ncbi:MAG TPA: cutinase family protein, partial [Protaetiibacter sp.]|nr:cutinase family protein [Protaetiibacter sp.]
MAGSAKTTKKRGRRAMWVTGGAILTTIAVVSTVFTVLSINHAGRFAQTIDEHCAPLVVIAFRGSGEGNLTEGVTANAGHPHRYGDSELVTNGWEGVTLRGLFEELAHTEYEELRGDTIPVIPVGPASADAPFGYDAIPAVLEVSSIDSALSFSSSRLLHSASRGAEAATHLIRDYLRASEGCPILPTFVAVGFSQGAMAARHTAELNPESVSAVLKIGDPYQKPNAPGVRAGGAGGTGIIRWKADATQAAALDAYYGARELRTAICHAGDPICEFSPLEGLAKLAVGAYGEHLDYYSPERAGEAEEDALAIARLAHERRQLALAALEEGHSVSWDDASQAADAPVLRSVSLSFAGTPSLFSAFAPDHLGSELVYEFDLDGDGIFETTSPDGTVWVTFDDDQPRTISVRVTDRSTGTSSTGRTQVTPAPAPDGEIIFTRDGELVPETPPAPPEPPVVDPPPWSPPTPPAPPAPPAPPVTEPPAPPAPATPIFGFVDDPVMAGTWAELEGANLPPDVWVRVTAPQLGIDDQTSTEHDGTFVLPLFISAVVSPGTYTIDIEYEGEPGVWTSLTIDVEIVAPPYTPSV